VSGPFFVRGTTSLDINLNLEAQQKLLLAVNLDIFSCIALERNAIIIKKSGILFINIQNVKTTENP
jgi:hypothetical protein